MTKEPILTVLFITYNHKPYFVKAIESILEQKTNFAFKIHVFDDCSTDGTSDLVREYAQKYPDIVIPFIHEKNLGVFENVSLGFKSIKTKYIANLEGDDYWCDENKLQIAVDALEKHPECVMFAHNTIHRYKKGDKVVEVVPTEPIDSRKIYYLEDNFFTTHPSSRVFRNIIDFTQFDSIYLADVIFYKILLSRGALYYDNQIMSVYNITGKGIWSGLTYEQKNAAVQKVDAKIAEYLDRINYDINLLKENIFNPMNYEELLKYLNEKKTQKHIDKLAKKYKGQKVLIYGAGLFFDVLHENFDLSKLNITAISDKKFEQETVYKGVKAISPAGIKNLSFDVMLIATIRPQSLEFNLKKELYPECGEFKIDYLKNLSVKKLPAFIKIPCMVIIFFDFEVIKKSLEFITKYSHLLDITVVENKSDYTESQIKPYVMNLLNHNKISQYVLFDENISGNACKTVIDENLINLKSDYIIIADGNMIIDNENWIYEHLAIVNQPNVFCVGTQIDMSNLPNVEGADKWLPAPISNDNPIYIHGLTGGWFLTFKTKEFLKAFKYIKQNNLKFVDSSFHKYCCEQGTVWARTRVSKAYHLTWDSYSDPNHPYTKWKNSLTLQEIWHHDRYCSYKAYTSDNITCEEVK
jgi:glycosyltransferase involved in cell wall biosynthesis